MLTFRTYVNSMLRLQVAFFFPLAPFIASLFRRADLVPYLLHDSSATVVPAGHLRRSRGFKKKVLDNPQMNQDHRSLGLVSTTDGVPFFDDQKRGAWPFIIRIGNLPDGLSHHISNCHLHLLQPSEFWELDTDANVLRRRVRAPKNLQPYLHIIADDLHHAYHRGMSCLCLSCLVLSCLVLSCLVLSCLVLYSLSYIVYRISYIVYNISYIE